MRRTLALLASSAVVLVGLAPGAGLLPAHAADPVTGRLVDSTSPGQTAGAPNMTIQLREVTGTGPGDVVASDVTSADGSFSIDAGPSPDDEYYIRVLPGAYQGGWVGDAGDLEGVLPTAGDARTYGPHASLGRVLVLPAFVRGTVVNAANGNRVNGVTLRMIEGGDGGVVHGSDVSGPKGLFRIGGLTGEDNYGLRVVGEDRGYENGWLACNGTVVATFGEACAAPLGKAGKVRLDRLP